MNYKNNPLRQASKCAGDAGLCPECSRQQRLALHPFHLQPPKQLHLLPLIALGHQHQELSRHRHRRSVPTRRILQRRLRRPLPQRPQFLVIGRGQLPQLGVPGFSARAGIALNGQAVCRPGALGGLSLARGGREVRSRIDFNANLRRQVPQLSFVTSVDPADAGQHGSAGPAPTMITRPSCPSSWFGRAAV